MADQNSENEDLEIKLNEVIVGNRTLRHIYLYHADAVSTVWDERCECIPLFLGSDVLVDCNISHGNLPRAHAKHAKRGLATKVNFPPRTKVLGIHGTARGVWFYSIQGTFKVAFDYYTRHDQDGCLRELEKMWRSHLLDPLLRNEIHVVMRKPPELTQSETAMNAVKEMKVKEIKSKHKDEIVKQITKSIDDLMMKTKEETVQYELGLLKTYVSFVNHKSDPDCFASRTVNLFKNCLGLLPEISESCDFSEKEVILSEIAGWLGTEFANCHVHVGEQVTAFKQKHIRSIENLPSAEILVNEVFPKSMKVLLCHWLQLASTDNQNLMNNGSENSMTLFPVIQIILELANQNLLSGVAHVLYSRLILSDSV